MTAQALKTVAEMTNVVAARHQSAITQFEAVKGALMAGTISASLAEFQTKQLAQIKNNAEQEMDSLLKVAASLIARIMIAEAA